MTKKNWQKLKKQLPRNFAVEAAAMLSQQGFQCHRQFISDVVRGSITDPEKTEKVWSAIATVKTNYQRKIRRIKKLQQP